VAGLSVAIAVVAAVLMFYREHLGGESGESSPDDGAGSGTSATESATDGGGEAGAETGTATGRAEQDRNELTGTVNTDPSGATTDPVDETLLSDEERIERLLEHNGGRMRQADIVKETGWSNAKVSQLLSSMAEQDQVDKLRIGRENLISFPDVDVTEFDDDL
jgi:hypothetical protein